MSFPPPFRLTTPKRFRTDGRGDFVRGSPIIIYYIVRFDQRVRCVAPPWFCRAKVYNYRLISHLIIQLDAQRIDAIPTQRTHARDINNTRPRYSYLPFIIEERRPAALRTEK